MFNVQALLMGDETALEAAIDVLSPELYRYAVGILLSGADAEDAVQNAFVSFWKHRSSLHDPKAIRAYLYRCTYHASVDIIRRNHLFLPLPQQQETNILSDIMCDALSHLSAAERAIVYERAVMDTPYAELAKRLGLREDNVRKKYERAKKKLAKLLAHTKKGDFL